MRTSNSFQALIRRLGAPFAMVVIMVATSGAMAASPIASADTLVVVVSAASPISEISRLHLADLYMGRTTRFPNGERAVPIDQRAGSADRAAFSATYLGRSEAQMKAHWSRIIFTGRGRPPAEASSGEAVRDIVAGDRNAIGYIEARLVDSRLRVVRVR
jgi:ABC-type phosphate transport system substrate-binding protein